MTMRDPGNGPPRLAQAAWLARPDTQAVFAALQAEGHQARAVGGAVRDTLLGVPVKEVDIATTALPEEVMRLAAAAGLAAVPTGIEHGTVTVIANASPYEVTTLRKDIETFGRHARVTFTTDWTEDAQRRDFTINALYCGPDGTVYDPINGWPDLRARRVRFIGEARERIREDYLRILRFFRFTAEYASGEPDPAGLAACVAERAGLATLSAERLRAELLRLLAAPRAVPAVAAMIEHGLLEIVLGASVSLELLSRLAEIEAALGRKPDPLLRLAALAATAPADASALRERLRLSSAEHGRLARALSQATGDHACDTEGEARILLYQLGADGFRDRILLSWARSADPPDSPRWRELLSLPERWTPPERPVRGADLLARGLAPGPQVGRALAEFERWWIAEGFPSDRDRVEAKLREIVDRVRAAP